MDENYYVSQGGQIPVKWTAPEVNSIASFVSHYFYETNCHSVIHCM